MSAAQPVRTKSVPPLFDGQRLDQKEFVRRYEAMPSGTKAELIGGVVAMVSPAGIDHGDMLATLSGWLSAYTRRLPGLKFSVCATTRLDDEGVPEPDLHLRILPEHGGQTRIEDGFVSGAPEFAVEVSVSTRSKDLGPKRDDYERAGVLEYLVVTIDPDEIHWFVNREGQFTRLAPGPDGLYRSEVFPGLWLDPGALFADDVEALLQALARGKATPEHLAFAAELAARKPRVP